MSLLVAGLLVYAAVVLLVMTWLWAATRKGTPDAGAASAGPDRKVQDDARA
jgi:hypothetical protein